MPDLIPRASDGGSIGARWCSLMHDSPMWPIRGHYQCRICARQFPVPWVEPEYARPPQARQRRPPPIGSVLPKLVILALVIARPIQATETLIENLCPPAAIALQRYIMSQGEVRRWALETIQIDASLPKLAKNGRLRAIRRLLPFGHPQYQVLESSGDSLVKRQVIVRYLSADAKTAELPAGSVATIPANYRFRYLGVVQLKDNVAYAFQITPRKKREGLLKGVLWLDEETGVAVRQSGYLVKSPSIFVKRISLTRENCLHDGAVEARITYLSIETRLVGRAQLVIEERPSVATGTGSSEFPAAQ